MDSLYIIGNGMDAGDALAELLDPAKYRGYLHTMSHFSSYSWRNIYLVYKQMPRASKLADFKSWKEQYGRSVIRGSKSIKILAPIEQKPVRRLAEKVDPSTGAAVIDENGKRVMEEVSIESPMQYKQVSLLDISQTEGNPVLRLAGDVMSDESLREVFIDVLKTMLSSSEWIDFHIAIKRIVCERLDNDDSENGGFIADSVAFVVCRRFNVETDADISGHGRPLDAETLEAISKQSDGLITHIEDRFAVICKERGIDPMTLPKVADTEPQAGIESESTPEPPQETPIETSSHNGTKLEEKPKPTEEPQYTKELRTETIAGVEFSQYAVKPISASEEMAVDEDIIENKTEPPALQTVTEITPPTPRIPPYEQSKPDNASEQPTLKHLPDPAITIAERKEYGYTRPELLPLTKDRAISLFRRDMTIYMLYRDDTEAIAHYITDIQNHNGIFGIAYGAWLNSREYIALASGDPEAQKEAGFIYDGGDSFAVYQTEPGESPAAYKSYEELQKQGSDINRHNYSLVYTAPLPDSPSDTPAGLFMWVNAERPEGYGGRALAISDVLSIKKDKTITSYYANGRTFKELLSFIGEEGRKSGRGNEIDVADKKSSSVEDSSKLQSRNQPESEPPISPLPISEAPTMAQSTTAVQPAETPLMETSSAQTAETQASETTMAQASAPTLTTPPPPVETISAQASAPPQAEAVPPQTPPPPAALPIIISEIAVYRLSAEEAEGHGASELYEFNRRIDTDCAKSIAKAIQAHKKGGNRYDLATPAEDLLKAYGAERMMWALSKHILAKPSGFSNENISWARSFIDDGTGSGDEIPAFAIGTHHAVLDAFASQFRAALGKKPTFSEKMKSARKKSEAHNNSSG